MQWQDQVRTRVLLECLTPLVLRLRIDKISKALHLGGAIRTLRTPKRTMQHAYLSKVHAPVEERTLCELAGISRSKSRNA